MAITPAETIQPGAQVFQKKRWKLEKLVPYLFVSPFILAFLILFLGPALYALVVSFFRYAGYGSMTFIGLYNYVATLNYRIFWMGLRNTLFYWIAHTIPMMAIAFGLALIVSNRYIQFRKFFKTMIYLPQLVTSVATALIFSSFFGMEYGVLNQILGMKIPWLIDVNLARWAVIILLVWHGVGYWFIVYLAGLTSINPEIIEAAIVDGANGWTRFIYVILPLMKNTLTFAFVMDAIGSLRIFTEPNVLMAQRSRMAPNEVAPVINVLFSALGSGRFGQAAAVGWIVFIITILVSWAQFKIFNTMDKE
jgi:ABC-type sugar transport system permease subunit